MASDQPFWFKFWGVRGGYPKPGPSTNRVGGNTTCLEIRAGKHVVIIDAGTGIIELGQELLARINSEEIAPVLTLIFTHTHHDHTQGFPFFIPARLGNVSLNIFGPKMLHDDLEAVLARAMLPPVFPVALEELQSQWKVRNIHAGEMIVLTNSSPFPQVCNIYRECHAVTPEQVQIRILHSYAHPKGGVLIYKIEYQGKKMVFATDTEGYDLDDRRLVNFAQGADVLIHDAEYTPEEYANDDFPRQGWGHSHWQMAVEVAKYAQVKRLFLTHHNANHDDDFLENMEREAQAEFPDTIVAREGMTVEL